ncbi:hypothetical protein QCA50_020497 [Cerrena zonata]|uniref:Putative transcription factor kapC n=1 Tax=Cerrena zonata TaxID=2478898 RepID=A0AAW0F909_9APHY
MWKDENANNEEHIDPTFARHQDPDFPTVEDVTAAAVANANRSTKHQEHDVEEEAAQFAAHIQQAHQQQQREREKEREHEDEQQRQQQQQQHQQQHQQQQQQHQQQHQHQHQHPHEEQTDAKAVAAVAAAAAADASRLKERSGSTGGPIRHHSSEEGELSHNGRPISGTKRAAQNRNAQKAFRQRKDKYVKDLEATAREVVHLKETIEELRAENLQLRDYTLELQGKVIALSLNREREGERVPTPPLSFNK